MRSGFFNSNIIGYDDNGIPIFDKAQDAEFFAKFFSSFLSNGVYPNPSNNMMVVESDGMNVNVNPGLILINGYFGWEQIIRKIATEASSTLDRIDRLVARLNLETGDIDYYFVKGTPATVPTAPILNRPSSNEGGDIYEMSLSTVFIAKNTTSIPQHRITDTRHDSLVCGIVSQLVQTVDTSELYQQYQASLNDFLSIVETALGGTLAGNLQNQINDKPDNYSGTSASPPTSVLNTWKPNDFYVQYT